MTVVELVRHTKAYRRDQWWGKADRERPLTEAGLVQARRLARQLVAQGTITGLYSSPFVRCVQTLEPLEELCDVKIVTEPALGEGMALPVHDGGDAWVASAWLAGRAVAFLDRIVGQHAGERIVLCSHGDVIPALAALLVGRDGIALENVRCRKGGRFTLVFDGAVCADVTVFPEP
ncbi:MAG: phosphoglycerate mutase family protein [Egibacteraceae bacterium]